MFTLYPDSLRPAWSILRVKRIVWHPLLPEEPSINEATTLLILRSPFQAPKFSLTSTFRKSFQSQVMSGGHSQGDARLNPGPQMFRALLGESSIDSTHNRFVCSPVQSPLYSHFNLDRSCQISNLDNVVSKGCQSQHTLLKQERKEGAALKLDRV